MTSYCCKKCNFTCQNYGDIKRHVNKKKICDKKNLDCFGLSDDEIFVLTMIPFYKNKQSITISEIKNLKNSNIIYKNKDKLFDLLDDIDKNKIKKCKFCIYECTKITDLKKHLIINCFIKKIMERDNYESCKYESEHNLNIINSNNLIINNQSQTITNNIYFEIKPPLPFDGEWDISKLDDNFRARVLISQIMYTTLLDEILKNKDNLNVIIDKESKSGMVYKNEKEKYISMKLKDIVDESMEKLKKHLLEINEEARSTKEFDSQIIRFGKSLVLGKYNDYKKYEGVTEFVNDAMSCVYEKQKEEAIKKSIELKELNTQLLKKGF